MPEQRLIWNDERAYYPYVLNILTPTPLTSFNGKFKDRNGNISGLYILDKDEEIAEEEKPDIVEKVFKEIAGAQGNEFKGVDGFTVREYLVTDEALQEARDFIEDLRAGMTEKKNSCESQKGKQFYADLEYLLDPKNGNFMEAELAVPYMRTLQSILPTMPKIDAGMEAELKDRLGPDLFNAYYDFYHACVNEYRAEYHRQELAKNWDAAAERTYLTELRATHADAVRMYEQLQKFHDDPECVTKYTLGNPLSDTLGRGMKTAGSERCVNAMMGWLRGEIRAIDNGWGADELAILGTIGALEEASKRAELYGNEELKKGMEQFKTAFSTLKSECWNTRVESAADKKAIADKVRAFVAAQDSPFAQYSLGHIYGVNGRVTETLDKIDVAATRDAEADRQHAEAKRTDSVAYLRALEDKAAETGDLRPFVQAYCNLLGKNAEPGPGGRADNAVEDYIDGLLQRRDNGFVDKVFEQACKLEAEVWIDQMRAVERKAEDIRAGRTGVDAAFEPIRCDYTASMELARHALVGTPADLQAKGARALKVGLDGITNRYASEIARKYVDEYIEGACDGLSPEKRRYLVQAGNSLFNSELKAFGAKQDTAGERFVNGPEPETTVRRLEQSLLDTANYWDTFKRMQTVAGKQLEELTKLKDHKATALYGKRDDKLVTFDANKKDKNGKPALLSFFTRRNSTAFMRMYHSLEKVVKLNSHATPDEVARAMRELGEASEGYERKIKNQTFAAKSDNGEARLNMSKELQEFAREQGALLQEASNGKLCPDERIADQGKRAKETLVSYKEFVKEKAVGAKAAEAGRQTELAQNEPKKENAQQAGM